LNDLTEAQTNFVEALSSDDPERDSEARFRFGLNTSALKRTLRSLFVGQCFFDKPARPNPPRACLVIAGCFVSDVGSFSPDTDQCSAQPI
jgi:hypothetical protein